MTPDGELRLSRLGEEIERALEAFRADRSRETPGALDGENGA